VLTTGGGVKSARVSCTPPTAGVGVPADTPFVWPTAFAGGNYTVTMTAVAGSGAIVSLAAYNQTAAGFHHPGD
jgi:hypothetical protein